ncbi:30S ribosomal protein S11 [Candidatus Falkowbacteria bacterium CG_4_10_14_0_2_um_filter_48_10]|uniref:Small ribosomal subunit protein uS11 n=1 Tax=Candidatus Falkowbacteria bacterium CG23_combo_of_CG06-09_8_20_14_all_49_15 TaxID=1974572 RepID=A0A2G9ZK19_9BACT|nr:MAG: 30S ribosomal protein S11 [Candidatus Falkowbacteria bacterium CG23_combo_of_CG06-09_8_20_14_all_49_15]PJA09224.1 MAG: 30S ribosomal protein S11 [Candidatus Falkowbacteria bacterium CG_4_10_14_0_2_um_filter_48_10]
MTDSQKNSPNAIKEEAKALEQKSTSAISEAIKAELSPEKPGVDESELALKKLQSDNELPDEIKQKLEKRKQERLKSLAKSKKKKKKSVRQVPMGKVFVNATYNNTIVSITDMTGNVIAWASAGVAGFKGPKKSTPYAAQIITRIAVDRAKEYGFREANVFINGVGTGRESAVRALFANGINVNMIKDITPIPHNGCRVRKARRV